MRYCRLRFAGALVWAVGVMFGGGACAADRAGTVVLAVGNVTDQAADGNRRTLHDGDGIYSGDSLSTGRGAYLDLDFADGGRILLRPGTRFQVERYHYAAAGPAQTAAPATARSEIHESAFFRLIKGGLRAISGLIGHVTRADYRLDTPVATIGIRGTEYDVRYCNNDCGDKAGAAGALQNGLYTGVDRGAIAISNRAGEIITTAGQFLYVHDTRSRIRLLRGRPAVLQHMRLPERYRQLEGKRLKSLNRQRLEERRRLEMRLKLREELRHRIRRGSGGG